MFRGVKKNGLHPHQKKKKKRSKIRAVNGQHTK